MIKIKSKKAELGATLNWIPITIIILFFTIVFLAFMVFLFVKAPSKEAEIYSETSQTDIQKNFFAFLEDNKDFFIETNFNNFAKNFRSFFNDIWQKNYVVIVYDLKNNNWDYFSKFGNLPRGQVNSEIGNEKAFVIFKNYKFKFWTEEKNFPITQPTSYGEYQSHTN